MSQDQEFLRELNERINAIERQMADLLEWLKGADKRSADENADSFQRITGIRDFEPGLSTAEPRIFPHKYSRFQRRQRGDESFHTHE